MANQDYKSDKVVEIIREFENTGNKYEVNGIDTSKATIFWRKENEKFQIVPKGSYTYDSGNTYLVIQDEEILQNASEFQIVYIYEQSSSTYDEDFPQLEILVNKYNQVVDDLKDIYKFLGNTGVKSDTLQMTRVLPQLEEYCVWFLENGEIKSLPISELYAKFDGLVEALYEAIKKLLDIYLGDVKKELQEELKKAIESLNTKLEELKLELDEYTQEKIQEIQLACDRLLLIAEHKVWKANTIEDLKSMQFLKSGDVVEVLGYYQAGDGAGHKRVIADSDDGSGVQLSNGLWANTIKNSYGVNENDIENLKKSKLNKIESEINDTDKNVVNAINKALGNSNTNMQEIEELKNKKISEQDIQDNSIPAYKFKTSSDLDKIKLINLSEEVIRAMTGETPVSPAIEDNSITTNKIADNAITVRKIEDIDIGNYFDKGSIENVDGGYLSSGEILTDEAYSYSHKIKVQPNDLIRNNLYGEPKGGSCYTSDDVFVADLARESYEKDLTSSYLIKGKYRVPNNKTISYVKVNYRTLRENEIVISINREFDNTYYEYNELIFGEKFVKSIGEQMIKDNSITQEKIKSYSLGSSTNIKYVNLFNKNDITPNVYVDGVGDIKDHTRYFLTNFIPIKSLDKIYMPQYGEAIGGYCYDENGNKIGALKRISYEEPTTGTQVKGLYEAPNNDKIAKVRLNGLLRRIDNHTCYLNYISDEYVPYGYKEVIPNADLKDNTDVATNILYGKKIALTGDSICHGAGFKGGYGKIIADRNNMKYQNIAVGGGTITAEQYSSSGAKRFWICRSIQDLDTDADYVLLEGGVNDGGVKAPLGTVTVGYDKSFDDTTYCGAFESMCKQTVERFAGKKIGFVIVHKMSPTYTTSYYDITIEMLKKWGIPYVDLHSDCPPLNYIPSLRAKYTYQSDGWHPNEEGYRKYYVDKIESFLRRL